MKADTKETTDFEAEGVTGPDGVRLSAFIDAGVVMVGLHQGEWGEFVELTDEDRLRLCAWLSEKTSE